MLRTIIPVSLALALLGLASAAGCRGDRPEDASPPGTPAPEALATDATYVGRNACSRCHAGQVAAYSGSHHDLAMQEATPATVLGDFRDTTFTAHGVTTRFSSAGGVFTVRTDGPDGRLQDFRVAYVFGVHPLQQYLLALPGGRYQALGIAWDSRPRAEGGQRWFHLYRDERLAAGDPLHWTAFSQNWNAQCAACHSTNLRKNYDRAADTYETTWSEIDVSCEQCHGPGSLHVRWADARTAAPASAAVPTAAEMGLTASLRERRDVRWTMDAATGIARRSPAPPAARAEVDVCAPCHARRAEMLPGHVPGQPFLDAYRPSLLSDGLYHADGRIQDEVYEYGSFLQSRMYAAGVTCSDCHEPHALTLRADGNALCAQCHLPSRFDVATHHGHEAGTPGASCIGCHMPETTYMGVDRRHDHGFRVPRPDLTASTGAPDACTQCHTGRTPAWAAAALDRWRPPTWRQRPQVAEAFAAARQGRAAASPALVAIAADIRQPPIVRASAVELLQSHPSPERDATLQQLAGSDDVIVRLAVAQALVALDPASRARIGGRLLDDPSRVVRLDAAAAIAGEGAAWLTMPQQEALARSLDLQRASDAFNADRPESYVNAAIRAEREGDLPRARSEYEAAISRLPWFLPPYVNLADLQREAGDEAGAERTLRQALVEVPGDPGVLYSLGLSLYRQQRGAEATEALARAARGAPETPRYAFAHALALEAQGRLPDALRVIDEARARHPDDRDLLDAGFGLAQKAGDLDRARMYVRELLRVSPGAPDVAAAARALGVT